MNQGFEGMLPSCWGPMIWGMSHSIAYSYNPKKDKDNYFMFFSNLGNLLPCEECRLHYSQNFNRLELLTALENTESLFRWTYDLHNKINKKLGVPESKWPNYESVKQKYSSYKASCSDIPGVCGSKSLIKKKIKIIEEFGSVNGEQLPFIISIVGLVVLLVLAFTYIMYSKKKRQIR